MSVKEIKSTLALDGTLTLDGNTVILKFKCEDDYAAIWLHDKFMLEGGMSVSIKTHAKVK